MARHCRLLERVRSPGGSLWRSTFGEIVLPSWVALNPKLQVACWGDRNLGVRGAQRRSALEGSGGAGQMPSLWLTSSPDPVFFNF